MNIHDYWLQSQMQQQAANQAQPQGNPAILAAAQQPMQSPMGNPLDSGVHSAIGAVRQSLTAKAPHEGSHGFLGSVGKALSNLGIAGLRGSNVATARELGNIMQTPAEQEAARMQQNMGILKFLKEQELAQREHELKQQTLDETRRYHDILGGYYGALSHKAYGGAGASTSSVPGFDLSEYPEIKSVKERNDYSATLKGSNMALKSLEDIKKTFDKLKGITKENVFSPTGSVIPGINTAKDYTSRVFGDRFKTLNQEVTVRTRLESQFARLEPVLEKGLKGSAAGEQLLKRFHDLKVYFSSNQPMNIIEDRLSELLQEVQETRDLAKWSLKTGRHIDALPKDDRETPNEVAEKAIEVSPQEQSDVISKVKAIKPGLSDAAILEAKRRLGGS